MQHSIVFTSCRHCGSPECGFAAEDEQHIYIPRIKVGDKIEVDGQMLVITEVQDRYGESDSRIKIEGKEGWYSWVCFMEQPSEQYDPFDGSSWGRHYIVPIEDPA